MSKHRLNRRGQGVSGYTLPCCPLTSNLLSQGAPWDFSWSLPSFSLHDFAGESRREDIALNNPDSTGHSLWGYDWGCLSNKSVPIPANSGEYNTCRRTECFLHDSCSLLCLRGECLLCLQIALPVCLRKNLWEFCLSTCPSSVFLQERMRPYSPFSVWKWELFLIPMGEKFTSLNSPDKEENAGETQGWVYKDAWSAELYRNATAGWEWVSFF